MVIYAYRGRWKKLHPVLGFMSQLIFKMFFTSHTDSQHIAKGKNRLYLFCQSLIPGEAAKAVLAEFWKPSSVCLAEHDAKPYRDSDPLLGSRSQPLTHGFIYRPFKRRANNF
jgi:hypothetical protein